MYGKFQKFSTYQKNAKQLINRCVKFVKNQTGMVYTTTPATQMPFEDYLKVICTGNLSMFYVYYRHNKEDFKSCKFVTDFCGRSIDGIIASFATCNMSSDISYSIRRNTTIYEILTKIFTTHLVVYLAQIFSIIDTAIKTDTFCVLEIFHYSTGSHYLHMHNVMHRCMLSNNSIKILDQDEELVKKILEDTDSKIEKDILKKFICEIFNKLRIIYSFFSNKTASEVVEYCEKNPDLTALVSRFFIGKKIVSKFFMVKYIIKLDNLILEKLILEDIDQDTEQIKDLKTSFDRIPKNILFIEI
jgi:hypothetical protein